MSTSRLKKSLKKGLLRPIAEMLGISEGTSKSQYARARQLLREMLKDKEKVRYERQS